MSDIEMNDGTDEGLSMFTFSEDLSDAEKPPVFPVGEYEATIVAAKGRLSSGGHPMLQITWNVPVEQYDPEYKADFAPEGKKLTQFQMMTDNAQNRYRVRKFLEAIGYSGDMVNIDVNALVTLNGRITVEHDTYQGEKVERINKVDAI